ncbi:MAG: glycyl-radical enzyme activator family protein [Clostridiaceae bacterium]|jgi:pyruvate formate lyase activating enzyme|nr:glycyl-radical enzyme activator family protein [Clostridiaceae bacterium]
MKGLIFNIQRYSIHDGSGIRTLVFFKGCPLHCPWCCNPESQSYDIEQVKIKERCINCKVCSHNPIDCPADAITEFGKYMTVQEIIKEAEKDMPFYQTSDGGVTLSGGEVLSQAPFAIELLKELKKLGINTAIETSGQGTKENLLEMTKYLDTILFDLKIMNNEKAFNVLGADMKVIIGNLMALVEMNNTLVIPRVPLIPTFNMDEENISAITGFVNELGLKEIHILPFHQYGSKKYEYVKKEYSLKELNPPTDQEVNRIKDYMEQQGLKVVVGGL